MAGGSRMISFLCWAEAILLPKKERAFAKMQERTDLADSKFVKRTLIGYVVLRINKW